MIAHHLSARSNEKILEDAQFSGSLIATNRRLKDLDLSGEGHFLLDTCMLDFTGNYLTEVPLDICEWHSLRSVVMSRNLIKTIPEFLLRMRLIRVLDLSNNFLSHLPASISEMKSLVMLKLSNNNVVSIPDEVGKLKRLQELDVSGNQIDRIPPQVGDMESLLHLDVSRNNISILPDELSKLSLVHLDASSNKISSIPLCFDDITSLQQLIVHDNPLVSPPLKVLKKGRVHLFKSLQLEVAKSQRMQENAFSSKKPDDLVSQVTAALGVSEALNAISNVMPEEEEIFVDSPVENMSPVKAQTNGVMRESPTKRPKSASSPKRQSPKKKSPKKSQSKEVKTPRKQSVADIIKDTVKQEKENMSLARDNAHVHENVTNVNHNRRNSREAKISTTSSFPGYTPLVKDQKSKRLSSHEQPHFLEVIKPRTAHRKKHTDTDQMSFTMRRRTEKIYEEMEMLEGLRESIASRLKMPLPPDLMPALADGVILCHLANHLKARSIPTIHVPSPAVPKLSMAKCRRNVDNFLDACTKLGVNPKRLCDSTDILHERNIPHVTECVKELLKLDKHKSQDHSTPAPSVKVSYARTSTSSPVKKIISS